MYHNSPLYLTRQRCNEAVVLFYRGQSVIRPVVFEVWVDLAVKWIRQWSVFSEASEQGHPIVQFEELLLHAWLIECLDNLDKRAHDIREISNSKKHEHDYENHLQIRFGTQVTVSDRGQRRYWEVTNGDQSEDLAVYFLYLGGGFVGVVVFERAFDEGVPVEVELGGLQVWEPVEEAPEQVGHHDCHED